MKHLNLLILVAILTLTFACRDGEMIEQIGNHKVTTSEYEQYYEAYLEKAARLANAEKATLYSMMCNPDRIPEDNPLYADLVSQLNPENNYERYREMRTVEQVARADGFLDRPVVKAIIEQVVLETIAQLYMHEKLDERMRISLEAKQERCEELRQRYPQQMAPVPYEQCIEIAAGQLRQETMAMEYNRLQGEIKESITVTRNPDFDRMQFLNEDLELYQVIRREGGCVVDESIEAIEDQTDAEE